MEIVNGLLGQPIVQILIGAGIAVAVSWYFASRASKELARETCRLSGLVSELAHLMHEAGLVEASFNEKDKLVNVVRLRGGIGGSGGMRGSITVGESTEDSPAQQDEPSASR